VDKKYNQWTRSLNDFNTVKVSSLVGGMRKGSLGRKSAETQGDRNDFVMDNLEAVDKKCGNTSTEIE